MSRSLNFVSQLCRRHAQTLSKRGPSAFTLAHSSWFMLPDQGMEKYEILAEGSGFIVQGPSSGLPVAVISAHVAAPHRFPMYFPQEWLQHVTDKNCRTILQTCKAGKRGETVVLELGGGFRHATLDMAAFVLDDKSRDVLGDVEMLKIGDDPQIDSALSVCGFRLIGQSEHGVRAEGLDEVALDGVLREVRGSRGFVYTRELESDLGMCGGPIIQDGKCIGLLEGLVPQIEDNSKLTEAQAKLEERLGGCSAYIGARELRMFVHDVETESARRAEDDGLDNDS